MASKTIFSRPTAKESLPRNSFPMSFYKNLNFSAGMLVPTFVKFVHGHSHVRLNQQSFIRTADVNTAAFPRLPLYTDYFFVPCSQIISQWNDYKSYTNDQFSASLSFPRYMPFFNPLTAEHLMQSEFVDGSGHFDGARGATRLLDLLGYGFNYDHFLGRTNVPQVGNQNLLFACAYQKVYFDHYRNTAYEQNDVFSYNLDDKVGSSTASMLNLDRLYNIFKLRYVNYRRDALNTIYPSINFVSYQSGGMELRTNMPQNLLGLIGFSDSAQVSDGLDSVAPNAVLSSSLNADPAGFTLENMRAAYALEKLLRVSAFAPQHVKDQFLARFGYAPKSASMRESIRLKSFKNDIIIGEVTATAQTGTQSAQRLGSIGGKGVGASSPDYALSYDTPEDGILIGISYVLPELSYDSNRVDLVNCAMNAEDFALPEYANLGLQPIFVKNVRSVTEDDVPSGETSDALAFNNQILGYQPRDIQFKSSVSMNHGMFVTNRPLSPFVVHGLKDFPTRGTLYARNGIDMYYFKCLPSDLDSLFVTSYDGDELNDQFYGHFEYHLNIIQDKPIFGIPNL